MEGHENKELAERGCFFSVVIFAIPVLLLGLASGSLPVMLGLGLLALAIGMAIAAAGMTVVGKKFFILFIFFFLAPGCYMPILLDKDFLDLASMSVSTGLLLGVIASMVVAAVLQNEKPPEGEWSGHGWAHHFGHNPEQCIPVALFLVPNAMILFGVLAAHGLPAVGGLFFGLTIKESLIGIFVAAAIFGIWPGLLFVPLVAEWVFQHED